MKRAIVTIEVEYEEALLPAKFNWGALASILVGRTPLKLIRTEVEFKPPVITVVPKPTKEAA